MDSPKAPSSPRPEMISSGMSALSAVDRSAAGAILSSAKRRKVSATNSKSASRWRARDPRPGRPARPGRGGLATKGHRGPSAPGSAPHWLPAEDRVATSQTASAAKAAIRPLRQVPDRAVRQRRPGRLDGRRGCGPGRRPPPGGVDCAGDPWAARWRAACVDHAAGERPPRRCAAAVRSGGGCGPRAEAW
jgi:hypothetical protein